MLNKGGYNLDKGSVAMLKVVVFAATTQRLFAKRLVDCKIRIQTGPCVYVPFAIPSLLWRVCLNVNVPVITDSYEFP